MIGLENYYKLLGNQQTQALYDEIWVIMRKPPANIPSDWKLVQELAPSFVLWSKAYNAKENGGWEQQYFEQVFVPAYALELVSSAKSQQKLMQLIELAKSGKRIALVCSCYQESWCHRAVLSSIVKGMCPDIYVKAKMNYSRYWDILGKD